VGLPELPKEGHPLDPVPEGGVWAPPPMVPLADAEGELSIEIEERLLRPETGYLRDGELIFNVEGWGRFRLRVE